MSLQVTPVSRCLDKKIMMFGYEALDVLLIFLTLSVLNLLFGETSFKLALVWLPTLALAALLRYGKRGKPENFLLHLARFQFKPGIYSAFSSPTTWRPYRRAIWEVSK